MKPILFSTPMVQAILDGRKSMTRRVVNPQPINVSDGAYMDPYNHNYSHFTMWTKDNRMCLSCGGNIKNTAHWMPRYHPGDILWVRETWRENWMSMTGNKIYDYRADPYYSAYPAEPDGLPWRPSIFMPKLAARIFLRVTDVRCERVQEISDDDAIKEGCAGAVCDCLHFGRGVHGCESCMNTGWQDPPTLEFMDLWDGLNAKRGYSWASNPWVWVISFERCEKPGEVQP